MSIEVLDGQYPASIWAEAHADNLIQAALLHGAIDWRQHNRDWGVVLELAFVTQDQWEQFRADAAVDAALEAVPNPDGLLIYRGWGGSSSPREPRRPRPLAGAGAAALPLPLDDLSIINAHAQHDRDHRRVLICR